MAAGSGVDFFFRGPTRAHEAVTRRPRAVFSFADRAAHAPFPMVRRRATLPSTRHPCISRSRGAAAFGERQPTRDCATVVPWSARVRARPRFCSRAEARAPPFSLAHPPRFGVTSRRRPKRALARVEDPCLGAQAALPTCAQQTFAPRRLFPSLSLLQSDASTGGRYRPPVGVIVSGGWGWGGGRGRERPARKRPVSGLIDARRARPQTAAPPAPLTPTSPASRPATQDPEVSRVALAGLKSFLKSQGAEF